MRASDLFATREASGALEGTCKAELVQPRTYFLRASFARFRLLQNGCLHDDTVDIAVDSDHLNRRRRPTNGKPTEEKRT